MAINFNQKKTEKPMQLKVTLSNPVGGYWDGGKKDTFYFKVDQDFSDGMSQVGSWEANAFKEVKTGKSEKSTLAKIRPFLIKWVWRLGVTAKFDYVDD